MSFDNDTNNPLHSVIIPSAKSKNFRREYISSKKNSPKSKYVPPHARSSVKPLTRSPKQSTSSSFGQKNKDSAPAKRYDRRTFQTVEDSLSPEEWTRFAIHNKLDDHHFIPEILKDYETNNVIVDTFNALSIDKHLHKKLRVDDADNFSETSVHNNNNNFRRRFSSLQKLDKLSVRSSASSLVHLPQLNSPRLVAPSIVESIPVSPKRIERVIPQIADDDDESYFGKCVANFLRSMDKKTRRRARIEFEKTMYLFECG